MPSSRTQSLKFTPHAAADRTDASTTQRDRVDVESTYAVDEVETIDPAIQCSHCPAACCRLDVHVMADDPTPLHWIERDAHGMEVMRRGTDGWCLALDRVAMRCSIYALRPQVCRDFAMGGGDCRDVRAGTSTLAIRVI